MVLNSILFDISNRRERYVDEKMVLEHIAHSSHHTEKHPQSTVTQTIKQDLHRINIYTTYHRVLTYYPTKIILLLLDRLPWEGASFAQWRGKLSWKRW